MTRDPQATAAATATADRGPLVPMDIAGRLGRLRAGMEAELVDALVVTSLANIRYLTGFTGSAGTLLVLAARTVLLTDGRYETQSAEQLGAAGVDVTVAVAPAVRQAGAGAGLVGADDRRIGLEAAHVTWAAKRGFAESWFPGAELVATVGLVERLRRVKDTGEIDRLGRAAAIADRALETVRAELDDGPTELEFGRGLDFEMRRLGAEGPAFETIVASGPNSAKPHHRPTSRRIRGGEPLVLDFGARFDGYHSDMTRTLWTGDLVESDLRRAVQVVGASQAAGVAAVAAGVEASAVDLSCRSVHRRCRVGGPFRARHGPRRRSRHPRGTVRSGDVSRYTPGRAMSSLSSPVCTFPVSAACGSRTPSW